MYMSDILQTNVFFLITSIAVIVLTVLGVVVLWYVIGILREVKKIAAKVNRVGAGVERDIEQLRAEFRQGSLSLVSLMSTVGHFFMKGISMPTKRAHTKKRSSSET